MSVGSAVPQLAVGSLSLHSNTFAEMMLTFPFLPAPCRAQASQQSSHTVGREAGEQLWWPRARHFGLCFPFLLHFSSSLDIELDSTWTEVPVFDMPGF